MGMQWMLDAGCVGQDGMVERKGSSRISDDDFWGEK